ncbi:MAG TPA: zinc-dependent alcohol dehydrogenase [Alphaproteobacteria bacterium]|nr:zinc-dependent alcohol dehydrogenase [Alphaproteobacteria bacterium]
MKAVVFHDVGDIRLEDVREPEIADDYDAIVRLTASAICGTDLHMIRGTMSGMKPGTILGHEGVGIIEELGRGVRNLSVGDRVVIPSTIACGSCVYCRAGYHAQCDRANPKGPQAGTAFFGGPASTGPFHGLQAEKARIPFAHVGLVKIPEEVTDDQALLLSDIFPTGYFGADLAEITPGDTVAVFGCGPVGQFVVASAKLRGASRIIAVDYEPSRLGMAKAQGAEIVNFDEEDPVEAIRVLTAGIGVDRAIDAVGVDAVHPHRRDERPTAAAAKGGDGEAQWQPGDGPAQALTWSVEALAKAGTLGIIGVYPPDAHDFPIGVAMSRNLTVKCGNCNHRKYIPMLLDLVRAARVDPTAVLTHAAPLTDVIDAYKSFDRRRSGWIKVELLPGSDGAGMIDSPRLGTGQL